MEHAFDLSDVSPPETPEPPEDKLDDILALSLEVLEEYGEEHAPTRIRRLAEWIVRNVGGEPFSTEQVSKGVERYVFDKPACPLVRVGGLFAIEKKIGPRSHVAFAVGTEAARAFAVATLRSCERDG